MTGSRLDEKSTLLWTRFLDAGAGFARTANCSITILRTLLERGGLTSVELESITGLCRGTVTSTLNSLRNSGYIITTGEMRRASTGKRMWNKMCKEYTLAPVPPEIGIPPIRGGNRPKNDAASPANTSMVADRRVVVLENENTRLREALAAAEDALWTALETIESVKKTEKAEAS